MNILFYTYSSRSNSQGEAPLYCRLTLKGERVQFSTKLKVIPQLWNREKQRLKGRSTLNQEVNKRLDTIEAELLATFNSLSQVFNGVTARDVLRNYIDKNVPSQTMLEVFREHNDKMKKLIDLEYTESTYKLYESTRSLLSEFLTEINSQHLPINRINTKTIEQWLDSLKHRLSMQTIHKHLKRLSTVINYAIRYGYIEQNACSKIRLKLPTTNIQYLTNKELNLLSGLSLQNEHLIKIRDWFLFISYTGLSFVDLKFLTHSNIEKREDGQWWLSGNRIKTGQPYKVLVNAKVREIIMRHSSPTLISEQIIFKLISHQKMNLGLKRLGKLCGIGTVLTCHLGRKTFSCNALNSGIPVESIAMALGHANIQQTLKVYAKVSNEKLERDLQLLDRKIA